MQISIANAIQVARRIGSAASIITSGLKMWLGFKTSEPLGREEVVNGDFATDLSGWTLDTSRGSYAWDVGRIKITNDAANSYANCSQDIATTIGGIYRVRGTVEIGTATTIEFRTTRVGDNATQQLSSDGTIDFTFIADQASTKLLCYLWSPTGNTDDYCYFDNISVKEVTQITPDLSGNSNVGKLFTGKALEFDGNNDSVDIDGFQLAGSDATFAFWINPDLTTGVRPIFDVNPTRLRFRISSGNLEVLSGSTVTFGSIASDQWQRVVIVINGTSADAYINGVQSGVTQTITAIDISTATLARIAANYTGVGTLDGKLSDFQVYNAVWDEDDIAYDYAKPNHLVTDNPNTSLNVTNLKAYWALSEGDGLVAYDSGITLEEDLIQNGDFSELGSELVVNGGFDTDTGWNKNPNWDISGGVAISDGTTNLNMNQVITVVAGASYEVSFDVVSISQGGYRIKVGATPTEYFTTIGSHTEVIVAFNTERLKLELTGSAIGSIDNISVKQVDPNDDWTLGTGWSYGDDKATYNGVGYDSITQSIGDLVGKKLQLEFEIKDWVSGTIRVIPNQKVSGSDIRYSGNGTYVEVYTAALDNFGLQAALFNGSITNISVTEITPSNHGGLINGATYVDKQPTIPQLGMMDWAIGSNLYLNSEPTSNEGVSGNITYGSYSWGLNGFSNATIYGDSSVTRYRYGATLLQNTEYTLSCYVIMDDLTEPSIGNNTASGDFSIIIGGGQATLNTTSVNVSGNVWRISRTITTGTTNLARNGIVKYTSQSDKGFKVVGWQLEQSATVGNYILTDGAAAIDVTTIENPANKGYDILGNPLRLREHSFNLDGSGYAEVADDDSLDVNEGFSVSFWRKLDVSTDGVRSALVTKGVGLSTAVDNGVALSMNNNSIVGDVNTNVGRTFIQKPLTINGSWVFVTFTYTKNEKSRLYIDTDAPIVSTTISGTINETHPIMIGTDKNLGFKDSALIDEVVWYDRPLSENEILNNYNVGLPTHPNSSSFSSDFGSDFGG